MLALSDSDKICLLRNSMVHVEKPFIFTCKTKALSQIQMSSRTIFKHSEFHPNQQSVAYNKAAYSIE